MTDNQALNMLIYSIMVTLFAAGWGVGCAVHKCDVPETKTVIKVVQAPPEKRDSIPAIYIPYAVPKIKWKDRTIIRYVAKQGLPIDTVKSVDSAIIVKPFVAKSDTVTFEDGSKTQATFTFPSIAPFRFDHIPAPDTTKEIRIVVTPTWYEKPMFVSAVTAAA